jgi:hypothetical protein
LKKKQQHTFICFYLQSNISNQSVPFTPSTSLTTDVIDELNKETNDLVRTSSNNDSLSDDGDINLYEMRLAIGKTYDTSDISVQLEGPKILIHCHTIEPTDKRGNYRKHEYKTELLVPDVVDDETIVAYLTEDGQLIVEGKYHPWAWKEIKRKRKMEQQETNPSSTSILATTSPPPSINSDLISTRKDGGRFIYKDRLKYKAEFFQLISYLHYRNLRFVCISDNMSVLKESIFLELMFYIYIYISNQFSNILNVKLMDVMNEQAGSL